MIKYIGTVVIYKIIDPHNYLLITLDVKLLRGLFEHERLKPAMLRTSKRITGNLSHYNRKSFRICLFNLTYRFH